MRIDLHTHSAVSDGTDAPAELVRQAARAGLDGVALTDHDTMAGIPEADAEAIVQGVRLLSGVEMSTQRWGWSVHLLAYGCDPANDALTRELARVRAGRTDRVPAMVARLTALGLPLAMSDVAATQGTVSLGRPHVADAMIAKGYVASREEAFARYLHEGGPAWVDRYATPVARAIDLVHAAGGVAVLAHPWGRGGQQALDESFLAELAADHALDGLEVDHPDHDDETRARLRRLADRLGLLVTGASDHHGLGKTRNPLGRYTTSGEVVDELVARARARGGSMERV